MKYDEIINCFVCHKNRARYIKNKDICQVCYRKMLDEYALYDYKEGVEMNKGEKMICRVVVEEGIKKSIDVAKRTGYSKIYVDMTIEKCLERVNTDGKRRPF